MSRSKAPEALSEHLAKNVRFLRQKRELSQADLAGHAGLPRPTLALIESGGANPTLAVLARLSTCLGVSIDELLSPPHSDLEIFRRGTLPTKSRAEGRVQVARLLPDPLPGLDLERLELAPGARMAGVPHRPGTREYLACERGALTLVAGGERVELAPGDVVSFLGDQPHSYGNGGERPAVGYSVITAAPRAVIRAARATPPPA